MLKDLIKKNVAPLLKQEGFKKKGLTWNKSKDGVVQVIGFQLSRHSSKEEEYFTINLGVFDPHVWKKCWGKEPPIFIREEDCFPRVRVGHLLNESLGDSTDHWWTCGASNNEAELGTEIEFLLEEKCLPFLDDMSDQNEIVRVYSSKTDELMPIEKIYLAVIKSSVGDVQPSDELLDQVGAVSEAWAKRVDQVRSRLS